MKAEKIVISIGVLGVLGISTYFLVRYLKKKKQEKKAGEYRKANPYKPLTESQLQQTGKSFTDFLERLKKEREKPKPLINNTQPKGFAQSGGFTSPSLIESQLFTPNTSQPLGTIGFTPKYL
jgi:uncharacterized SAM-binding protein YcdF (DUF218 family)